MKHHDSLNDYELVYCFWPKRIIKLNANGLFERANYKRGILVKRIHFGQVWYHIPEEYLEWKTIECFSCKLKQQ